MKKTAPLKRFGRAALSLLPFLLVASLILSVLFFPEEAEAAPAPPRVVRVWNVDTFEGGKGSRTAFLRRTAQALGKENGVYYLVSDYTEEGAEEALLGGETPDCISFGIGLAALAEFCLPLPYRFAGGEVGGSCLAYPWCRGEYLLFSRGKTEGRTAISVGGNNLPAVAAAFSGIAGEEKESSAAYVDFLSGKVDLLLGTQRDRCRFAVRGEKVTELPLGEYCDLFQYFSVLSAEKRGDCLALLDRLLSRETQEKLAEIGMLSAEGAHCKTPNVFSDGNALSGLASAARAGDIKKLEKILKTT